MPETIIRTVCPHDCPDMCSVLATVSDGRVISVAGDPTHVMTGGFLCGKVHRYPERVHSPERVLTPLRRTGPKGAGEFASIGWDEALDEIAARWRSVIAEYGSEALLGYAYSSNQGLMNRNIFTALFHALSGSRLIAGTVCDTACDAGWGFAVGEAKGTDPETVVESDLIIAWGANLVTTNVHLVPLIDQARANGAQLVVIDPYRTRTARRADWHIAPKIGTDTALALAMMHVLVRDGLCDDAFVAARTTGFEQLCSEVLPRFSPRRAAQITGVPTADIERLARMYGKARAPFIRLGMGMSRNAGGGMETRTIACLPALVGAWAKQGGGALLSTAVWGFDFDALRRPDLMQRPTRRINHSLLGQALVELADPPIKALFIASNNPAITCPDQQRVVEGLSRDDLFTVVHDTFLSDTARFADIVLPACTSFESEDLFRSYGTYYAQHGPRLIEPVGESRSNRWLAEQLAARLGLTDPVFSRGPREHMQALLAGATGPAAQFSLEDLIGAGPVKLPLENSGPEMTYLYSEKMAAEGLPPLPEWTPDEAATADSRYPLRLLTAPGHAQHHTAFAGVESLQRRQGDAGCLLHPVDAASRGISSGDAVRLFNEHGHIGLRANVTADCQQGVVVVEGNRSRARFLSGGPLNVLTSARLTAIGAGATYQSTWLEAALLGEVTGELAVESLQPVAR
ncbi:MAG: molybdopterin-containing oxidoreductase family protein [Dehalococcoidia bacterium]